jgi:hypothetical protein
MGFLRIGSLLLFSTIPLGIVAAESIDIKQMAIAGEEQIERINKLLPIASEQERELLLSQKKSIDILLHQLKATETTDNLKENYETTLNELKKELASYKRELGLLYAALGSSVVIAGVLMFGLFISGGLLIWALLSINEKASKDKTESETFMETMKKKLATFKLSDLIPGEK